MVHHSGMEAGALRLTGITRQVVSLDWEAVDYHGQEGFRGHLRASSPFVITTFVRMGDGYYYVKSNKNRETEIPMSLLFHRGIGTDAVQVIVTAGSSINSRAVWEGNIRPQVLSRIRFDTGHVAQVVTDDAGMVLIAVLVLSCSDIRVKRNGIWSIKPTYLDQFTEPWRRVMTKTRTGYLSSAVLTGLGDQ